MTGAHSESGRGAGYGVSDGVSSGQGFGQSSGSSPILSLRGLSVGFGGGMEDRAPGLSGVNLEIDAGERVVLVGASGGGKSTLLRAIAGLLPIRGGEIRIGGVAVHALPPEARGAVYLHQEPVLFPHLTVEENVGFPLRVRGVAGAARRDRVHDMLVRVQLSGLSARLPHTLSGGQRHRVALARAVIARPRVLLLDEPLTGLDPTLRREVRDTILVLLEGTDAPALLMVTHDLEEAGWMGSRVGILLDGALAQIAPPRTLFDAPASLEVARFLGTGVEFPEGWIDRGAADSASGDAGQYGVALTPGAMPEASPGASPGASPAVSPGGTDWIPREEISILPTGSAAPGGTLVALGRVRAVRYPGRTPVVEFELRTSFAPPSSHPRREEGPNPTGSSPSTRIIVLPGRGDETVGEPRLLALHPAALRAFRPVTR
jgi:ABC-type Fe3+/spermidine/putrescine transport system ATPase subunit